jgi:hypothetical protein
MKLPRMPTYFGFKSNGNHWNNTHISTTMRPIIHEMAKIKHTKITIKRKIEADEEKEWCE